MTIRALLFATAVGVAALASPAAAQSPSPEEQAGELVEVGNNHFNVAEYAEAISAYKQAYKLVPEPLLLWNIAQSYRAASDCANALRFYKNYVREAPAGDFRAIADQRIPEMAACARTSDTGDGADTADGTDTGDGTGTGDGSATDTGSGTGTDTGSGTDSGTGSGIDTGIGIGTGSGGDGGSGLHWASIGALAVGGLSLGVGGYFSLQALDYSSQVEDLCRVSCAGSAAVALEDKGEAAQRNATILYVAGGVAIAAGVGLTFLARSKRAERTPVVLVPTAGGAMAQAGWTF